LRSISSSISLVKTTSVTEMLLYAFAGVLPI